MIFVNIHEAKTKLSALIAKLEKGEKVRICRNGKPVADLLPINSQGEKGSRLVKHPVLSKIKINYDPTEPLTDEEWPEQYR